MSKYLPPDKEDQLFFKKMMAGISRLNHQKKWVSQTLKKNKKITSQQVVSPQERIENKKEAWLTQIEHISLQDPTICSLEADQKLFFKRPGLQHKVMKRLMRGEFYPAECLDLHGLTVEQARATLLSFLAKHYTQDHRSVLVIHGKGHSSTAGPKLKNHVNAWLMQIPWVLAFVSARTQAGGSGAVYILLARKTHR